MTKTNPEKRAEAGCVDAQAFHSCQDRLLSPQLTQAPLQPSYHHIKSYPALFLDCCCSVAKSRLALCDLLDRSTPGLPSFSTGVCSDSCPLSQRSHPTISSSVVPFSSCPQSFPASGSSPMGLFFASGGQSMHNIKLTILSICE